MAQRPTSAVYWLNRFISDRMVCLTGELAEARRVGVDTPGFNQLLGALDELRNLRDAIADEYRERKKA